MLSGTSQDDCWNGITKLEKNSYGSQTFRYLDLKQTTLELFNVCNAFV